MALWLIMFALSLIFFSLIFSKVEADDTLATMTRRDNMPELREGQLCTPGTSYKVSCNTCRCGEKNTLLCTKMACLDNDSVAALLQIKLSHKLNSDTYLRSESNDDYPELDLRTECVAGTIYKSGCSKCFCTVLKKALCSVKGCTDSMTQVSMVPEDVRPPFTVLELDSLPKLPHIASPCEAGKSYRIDCNACLCKADGNLLCDNMLCLSYDHYHKEEAGKLSGALCDENSTPSMECITCKCVEGVTECEAIEGCISNTLPLTRTRGQDHNLLFMKKTRLGLAIDPGKDNCMPNQLYLKQCNKCYCKEDGSLRCTQKKCLNHAEGETLLRH